MRMRKQYSNRIDDAVITMHCYRGQKLPDLEINAYGHVFQLCFSRHARRLSQNKFVPKGSDKINAVDQD